MKCHGNSSEIPHDHVWRHLAVSATVNLLLSLKGVARLLCDGEKGTNGGGNSQMSHEGNDHMAIVRPREDNPVGSKGGGENGAELISIQTLSISKPQKSAAIQGCLQVVHLLRERNL